MAPRARALQLPRCSSPLRNHHCRVDAGRRPDRHHGILDYAASRMRIVQDTNSNGAADAAGQWESWRLGEGGGGSRFPPSRWTAPRPTTPPARASRRRARSRRSRSVERVSERRRLPLHWGLDGPARCPACHRVRRLHRAHAAVALPRGELAPGLAVAFSRGVALRPGTGSRLPRYAITPGTSGANFAVKCRRAVGCSTIRTPRMRRASEFTCTSTSHT